jgi:hypothetical protein
MGRVHACAEAGAVIYHLKRASQLHRIGGTGLGCRPDQQLADIGFSMDDRAENLRRLAHVARLMADGAGAGDQIGRGTPGTGPQGAR